MKMDRDINETGKGKYALVKLRELGAKSFPTRKDLAEAIASYPKCLDFGIEREDSEFFVIRLKDKYAEAALRAYAKAAREDGNIEWAKQVDFMAVRASYHPAKKMPD